MLVDGDEQGLQVPEPAGGGPSGDTHEVAVTAGGGPQAGEIGAGLGPLAGRIWRVGLMGASSTPQTLLQFLAALEGALVMNGFDVPEGAAVAAASAALRPQMANA